MVDVTKPIRYKKESEHFKLEFLRTITNAYDETIYVFVRTAINTGTQDIVTYRKDEMEQYLENISEKVWIIWWVTKDGALEYTNVASEKAVHEVLWAEAQTKGPFKTSGYQMIEWS